MIDRQRIEQAIARLKTQEGLLGEDVVHTSLTALRHLLSHLEQDQIQEANIHGERKLVTVMFADISGFTAMSEKLDPEEVRNLINLCFERLVSVIERFDGYIDKFIGDEIMALFGAPIAHENDAERALRAALGMVQALNEFNAEYAQKIPKPLALHFGINTGLVIAGGIGTSKRQDYSVMGDTVNLAARLEGLSESGEILIGEDTHRLTATFFEFEKLAPVKVKGKEKPVQIYRLLQATSRRGGQLRGLDGLSSPLVGRADELSTLQTLLANLEQCRGGCVSIIADAGLGKSRLVTELQAATQSQNFATWAEGRAISHATSASYLIARYIFHSLLDLDPEAPPEAVDSALRMDIKALFPDTGEDIYPYLAYLLDIPLDEKSAQRVRYLEGEALRQRVWMAQQSYFAAKAERKPLVLIWDDLHWADPSSLELLEGLLPLTQQLPLLLLLMFRPRKESRVWNFHKHTGDTLSDSYVRIELPALSPKHSKTLLTNLLGSCVLPEQIEQLILNKSEGNPFFLEEVIRSLLNSGALAYSNNKDCEVTIRVNDITIPNTLQGVIMSRIDRLPPDCKRILQVAAVIGRNFSYPTLEHILGQSEPVEDSLLFLEQQDLLAKKDEGAAIEYSFKHVFTQESVYQSLLRTDRRNLHQTVGEAIEAIFADNLEEQALILAHHFEKSNDKSRALKYLRVAGEEALASYSNQEAKELFSRALSLLEKDDFVTRWELLSYREQILNRLGERDPQATDLTIMQTLAELLNNDEQLAITHNRRAAYFDKISEYQAAAEAASAGLRAAQRANNAYLEAQSLNSLALASWRRFDYRDVQKWANQALEALKIVGAPTIRINSLLHLGRASYRLGQYDTALEYIRGAQSIATDIDNRESDALADLIFGWIYQRLGEVQKAQEHFSQMLAKRVAIGDRYGEATALSHLGWLAADQQAYEAGLDYCHQALTISRSINDRENEAYALSGLALNYEFAGNYDYAIANYEQALLIHREIGATTLAIFDQTGLARIALARQALEDAWAYIKPVADWIAAGNAQQFWDPWIIYLSTYRVLAAVGKPEMALNILAEAHTLLCERATEISNEVLQHNFLQKVSVNREIKAAWDSVAST